MEVAVGRVDFYGYGKIALKPSANPIESTMIRTGIYFVKSEKCQKTKINDTTSKRRFPVRSQTCFAVGNSTDRIDCFSRYHRRDCLLFTEMRDKVFKAQQQDAVCWCPDYGCNLLWFRLTNTAPSSRKKSAWIFCFPATNVNTYFSDRRKSSCILLKIAHAMCLIFLTMIDIYSLFIELMLCKDSCAREFIYHNGRSWSRGFQSHTFLHPRENIFEIKRTL